MMGPGKRRNLGPKPKVENMGKIFMRVLKIALKEYWLQFIIVIVCILLSAQCMLQGTLFTQSLIDDYITPMVQTVSAGGTADFMPLAMAIFKLAAILMVGILATWLSNRLMINVGQGSLLKIRKKLFGNMERLPIKYFDTHSHGDIMSVYTNDVDAMRQLIDNTIPNVVNSLVTVVITLVSMIRMSLPLTGVSILMVGVMLLAAMILSSKAGGFFVAQQKSIGETNGYIEEMMEGQKVVKVFCHEEKTEEEFDNINEKLRYNSNKANRFANVMGPINNNLGHISYVLCAVIGAAISINSAGAALTLGSLVAFLNLSRNFTNPVTRIAQQFNSVVMAIAGADRVFKLMDAEPEKDEGYVELVNVREKKDGSLEETGDHTHMWAWKHPHSDGSVTYTRLEGKIEMDDVDFGYVEGKTVLHNITLYGNPGQKIAFVGSTGAGKTTITNLINRFYDIQDGKIRYDGINVNKIRKDDLRRSLGMVLQDTNLFTGTVLENIRYGRLDATDDECIAAAKLSNADNFIRKLPDGYNTVLEGNGANLSQGQRQLLSIARTAVADPPALILDEATSSIDTRTEALVQKGMDALMKGRTTFVIAHRLSTVRNSDCIMVLEQGRIIERGTHDDLIAQKGRYYQLYTGNAIAS